MKRFLAATMLIASAFTTIGWGSTYDNRNDKEAEHIHDRDKGDKQADKERQGNDEDVKRTQGDTAGRRDVHDQGPLQDDNRGRF